jgi:hypothetical protein
MNHLVYWTPVVANRWTHLVGGCSSEMTAAFADERSVAPTSELSAFSPAPHLPTWRWYLRGAGSSEMREAPPHTNLRIVTPSRNQDHTSAGAGLVDRPLLVFPVLENAGGARRGEARVRTRAFRSIQAKDGKVHPPAPLIPHPSKPRGTVSVFYRPPADIDDFARRPAHEAALRQRWHDYIGGIMARRAAEGRLFYDAANDPAPGTAAARAPIPWNGFPRSIWQWFNGDTDPAGPARAVAAAEVLATLGTVSRADGSLVSILHRQQDEYCEWHTHRDRQDPSRIRRITFTAEGPEYFSVMAAVDLSLVGDMYREHVDPAVRDEELVWDADVFADGRLVFKRGEYNRWNQWNTALGAMHLTHPANTLGAEINLAADATALFPSVSPPPAGTLPTRLMCCAAYGGVNRSSDPLIGAGVNGFARAGQCVTLDNPVGLYIQDIAIGDLRDPGGTPIGASCLRVTRKSPDGKLILRAEVAPPEDADFTLDQCTFEGERITGGGLIARRITMVLFGLAKTIPGRTGASRPCRRKCCRKPDTAGFLKLVRPDVDCAKLTDADWAEEAPVTPGALLAEAADESSFEALEARLSAGRAPVLGPDERER